MLVCCTDAYMRHSASMSSRVYVVEVTDWSENNFNMMTSSNGNIFRVTGHLCGEFTGDSPQKGQWRGALVFCLNKRLSKHSWGWWFETLSRPLWHHYNVKCAPFTKKFMSTSPSAKSQVSVKFERWYLDIDILHGCMIQNHLKRNAYSMQCYCMILQDTFVPFFIEWNLKMSFQIEICVISFKSDCLKS